MNDSEPVFFEKNRVFRVYLGGKLFDQFLGDGSEDGNYPEEWVASAVKALNKNQSSEKEGVSKVIGGPYFDELLAERPEEMLGGKNSMGILVKYLDSAIRLPAQAHPDKAFSRIHFQSEYGKEECWIVLATRPGACIYYGFQDGVTKEKLKEAIKQCEIDRTAFEKLLVRYEVNPGDVVFIPAKVAHAIGAGCLILEVQEPTDFTIQPERWCGDYRLSDFEMYLGLDPKVALDCFSFDPPKTVKLKAKTLKESDGVRLEQLIGEEQTNSFCVNRIQISGGQYVMPRAAAVYCVTNGNGKVQGENYQKMLRQGDYFFLPASAAGKFNLSGEKLTVVECYS